MRAAVAAVMLGGYAFGGMGSGLTHSHTVSDATLTAAIQTITKKVTATKPATPAKPAMKTVEYNGYQMKVPSSWPVYQLNKDPRQCVRYDINAVYLGTPSPNQNCPPGLIGRADTVSIGGPAAPGQPTTPVRTDLRAAVGDVQHGPNMAAQPGTLMENTNLHEFAVSMPSKTFSVSATYGSNPDLIMQLLASLRAATAASATKTSGTDPQPTTKPGPAAVTATNTGQTAPPTGSAPTWTVPPSSWPAPAPTGTVTPVPTPTTTPTPAPGSTVPMSGFDTCTAPSLAAMKAWRAKYAAANIYIGGQEMACDYGNLSKSWVQSAEAMGWSLMPTFVGLQAPCNSFSDEINPSQAAAQGLAAANQAMSDASLFGLGKGTPVYFDMEAYNENNSGCVTAVLTFLDAWTRQLNSQGYVSGIYSSAASGITDLQTTTTVANHALAEPTAIWFALWDNALNLTGSPYMSTAVWPTASRSKQYAGAKVVSVGGYSIDIDSDLVNSAVARG